MASKKSTGEAKALMNFFDNPPRAYSVMEVDATIEKIAAALDKAFADGCEYERLCSRLESIRRLKDGE